MAVFSYQHFLTIEVEWKCMVGKYPFQVGKTIYIVANGHYIKEERF